MISVFDIMTKNPITVTDDMEITKATEIILENSINGVPVLNNAGDLVGLLCQSDLIAQQKKIPIPSLFTLLDGFFPFKSMKNIESELTKIAAVTVKDAMTPDPVTVDMDTSIEVAATLMVEKNYHTLPVMEKNKVIGVVGKEDILRTLINRKK